MGLKYRQDKLVSIGLPVYNAQDFIHDCIISIINQSYKNWELIVIDDGSTDDSLKIIRSFNDSRIKVFSDGFNKGLAARLNESIGASLGEIYFRMDADDIMLPTRVDRQVNYLTDNPLVDVVGGGAYIIDTDNCCSGLRLPSSTFDTNRAIAGSPFIHPTCAGKRDWFLQNPYDSLRKRSEDYDLWLRTSKFSHFQNIQEPVLFYRELGLQHLQKYNMTANEIIQILSTDTWLAHPQYHHQIKRKIKSMKLKKIIFNLASKIGLQNYVVKRRSNTLKPTEIIEVNRILRDSLSQNLSAGEKNNA